MGVHTGAGRGSAWTVVEPPNWSRDERLVLMELTRSPSWISDGPPRELEEALGMVLWRAVANVRQWAETPGHERAQLFLRLRGSVESPDFTSQRRKDARASAPELSGALDVFARLTQAPHVSDVGDLVSACRHVVAWAEERGFSETAMQFAEAAAAAAPDSPTLANLAGRVCRVYGERGRAELWYDRAIGLSRRVPGKRGARQYIHAHLGFAATLLEIGENTAALKHIRSAALTAKRRGMKSKAAEAFHDAMYLATVEGALGRAAVYARRAVAIYPYHHVRYPALAHDFALLLVYKGMYALALTLLQSTIRKLPVGADSTVVWGTIARSAAGAERRRLFQQAVDQVNVLAPIFAQSGAAALYSVAEGARLIGDRGMAEQYARRAIEQATATGSGQVVRLARHLSAALASGEPAVPELSRNDPSGALLRLIAPRVRLRLAKWRGRTWRPRRKGDEQSECD
jgi:tetratricopeptide (TPR) repeat protein